eukprot:gnl/MRDRNA2_/MRDRNA2_26984_c0_seq1.p1 gnl/MRDRNA2_/MRDRNA2_26984_c0~~gnl/MRDRNA2_/MRDRNA2_26984_c0_seq1.p1  ORF type:complete len:340 (+),score=25.93 gnl/MRDRNA2_/MRDRNA2_26984_c0_seq1:47-1021(+)
MGPPEVDFPLPSTSAFGRLPMSSCTSQDTFSIEEDGISIIHMPRQSAECPTPIIFMGIFDAHSQVTQVQNELSVDGSISQVEHGDFAMAKHSMVKQIRSLRQNLRNYLCTECSPLTLDDDLHSGNAVANLYSLKASSSIKVEREPICLVREQAFWRKPVKCAEAFKRNTCLRIAEGAGQSDADLPFLLHAAALHHAQMFTRVNSAWTLAQSKVLALLIGITKRQTRQVGVRGSCSINWMHSLPKDNPDVKSWCFSLSDQGVQKSLVVPRHLDSIGLIRGIPNSVGNLVATKHQSWIMEFFSRFGKKVISRSPNPEVSICFTKIS